ncbi:MAG TPA: hypothetical protein VHO25_11395, partial [Polyangiaceae bacterium]|nr:hypothetical protein [Polyangiaceae bacterium]
MQRAVRFLLVLVGGLALLALAGHWALSHTTRKWFEHDLSLRSRLAVASARQSLAESWHAPRRLSQTLADITRDERIMGAAACTSDGKRLAATEGYPAEFSCSSILDRMRSEVSPETTSWTMTPELPSGRVHLSVTLLDEPDAFL